MLGLLLSYGWRAGPGYYSRLLLRRHQYGSKRENQVKTATTIKKNWQKILFFCFRFALLWSSIKAMSVVKQHTICLYLTNVGLDNDLFFSYIFFILLPKIMLCISHTIVCVSCVSICKFFHTFVHKIYDHFYLLYCVDGECKES